MTKKKSFHELEFKDAFMFAAVMEHPEICRQVLERILGIPIRHVRVQTENSIFLNSDFRGIRLDAFADDEEGTIFDVEMQTTDRKNLPKRSRIYQAQMDVSMLRPREDFNNLPRSIIIFICTFDPFGGQKYCYTFQETCLEDGRFLGDETCKIFLNTKGRNENEVPEELVRFLSYVGDAETWRKADREKETEASADHLLTGIERRIGEVKRDLRKEGQYMLFDELLMDERLEGRAEGRIEGQEKGRVEGVKLVAAMVADGLTSELPRLSTDPEYLQTMLKTYGLLPEIES